MRSTTSDTQTLPSLPYNEGRFLLPTKPKTFRRLTRQKKDSLLHTTFPDRSRPIRAAKRRYINQWGTEKVVFPCVLGPVVRALP